MGRPINQKYIGNTTASGQQIQANAYFPGTSSVCTTAYIVKQLATNTYLMANAASGVGGRVQLVAGGVALNPGEANVHVRPYPLASNVYLWAEKITNRSVSTFDGNSYVWVDSTVTPVDGEARLRTA